jgi:hypothetical protein
MKAWTGAQAKQLKTPLLLVTCCDFFMQYEGSCLCTKTWDSGHDSIGNAWVGD